MLLLRTSQVFTSLEQVLQFTLPQSAEVASVQLNEGGREITITYFITPPAAAPFLQRSFLLTRINDMPPTFKKYVGSLRWDDHEAHVIEIQS